MSILIKGIEMPKENAICIVIFPNGKVTSQFGVSYLGTAVPISPHGDLVDRDEMFEEFVIEGQKTTRYKIGEKWELNGEEIRRVIAKLPSVIPAEE